MIEELWPTEIIEGDLSPDEATDVQLMKAAVELAASLGHPGPLQPEGVRTELVAGDTVTLGNQSGLVRSFLFSEVARAPGDELSGAVLLHDPRTASGMVLMPGLPWGRPHTVVARTGRFVVFPSWLSWTVLPLAVGHTMTVRSTGYFAADRAKAVSL
jgi:hypothetical protein